MKEKKLRLKVTCLTPKGKAEKAMKEWRKQFPTFKKPIAEKIVNDSKFYWVYEFEKEKKLYTFQKKVMLAELSIKKFYYLIMSVSNKANHMAKKFKWNMDRARRWAIKRINKRMQKEGKESIDDFKDIINMTDEVEMRKFLKKEIIKCEFLEDENEAVK